MFALSGVFDSLSSCTRLFVSLAARWGLYLCWVVREPVPLGVSQLSPFT